MEFVRASLVHDLTALLNPRGYVLVAQGVGGATFRRERRPEFVGGLVLLAFGLLFTLAFQVWWLGVPALVVGAALVWLRRPATVSVALQWGNQGITVTIVGARERGLVELLSRHQRPGGSGLT